MTTWLWIWLGVIALSLILEFVTMELVSIWFVAGGLIAIILEATGAVGYEIQIAVFLVVSIVLLISLRKVTMKLFSKDNTKTNYSSFIGETFELSKSITKTQPGEVKINGIVWTAVSENKEEIEAGLEIVVKEVKGNKIVVTKK